MAIDWSAFMESGFPELAGVAVLIYIVLWIIGKLFS